MPHRTAASSVVRFSSNIYDVDIESNKIMEIAAWKIIQVDKTSTRALSIFTLYQLTVKHAAHGRRRTQNTLLIPPTGAISRWPHSDSMQANA